MRAIVIAIIFIIGAFGFGYLISTAPYNPLPVLGDDREFKEEGEYHSISVTYPAHPALDAQTAKIKAARTIEAEVDELVQEFSVIADVESLDESERARLKELGLKYSLVATYKPYVSEKYVSYEFDIFMDTGGAHPNTFFKTLVFDQGGGEVSLDELFAAQNYLEKISLAALSQIKEQLRTRGGEESIETIIAEGVAPREENFQNFVVDGSTVRFLIPPYQVAAHAAGTFEVEVPLE